MIMRGMLVVERRGRVGAPAEAVWDLVRRAETLPAWLAGVASCSSAGEGYGSRRRIVDPAGAAVEARVIAYREPTLIAWRECPPGSPAELGPDGPDSTELHVELAPEGDGTTVRLIWVRRPGGLALRLFGVRRVATALERSLHALAAAG